MLFNEIYPPLIPWMADVDARLASLYQHEHAALRAAAEVVTHSRGKRLRPVLLLLACAVFGEVNERALTNAMLMEIIHTASLAHDDVVDEADSRRGEPSAPFRFGVKFSVLLGDYLLARMFEIATEEEDLGIRRMLGATATAMGRGVILELSSLNLSADEALYWQVVHGKTAALFAAAAEIGARIGGANLEQQHNLRRIGEAFGCAFQLSDDLLDLQGSGQETGKPLGIDWRQRRATLPVIVALRTAPPAAAAELRALWLEERCTDAQLSTLQSLIAAHGGFEYGWDAVNKYQTIAGDCLDRLPLTPGRLALKRLCQEAFPLPVLPAVTRNA